MFYLFAVNQRVSVVIKIIARILKCKYWSQLYQRWLEAETDPSVDG